MEKKSLCFQMMIIYKPLTHTKKLQHLMANREMIQAGNRNKMSLGKHNWQL